MPGNGMNFGSDYSLSYYDANGGGLIELGDVQNIKINAPKHDVVTRPYNGPPRKDYISDGYDFKFTINRSGAGLDDQQIASIKRLAAGAVRKPGFLNERVYNADGTISRYQYTNFVFWVTELADISREKTVTMQAEGFASEKNPIA